MGHILSAFGTRRDGRVYPKTVMKMYYQVLVTHSPPGYHPYTVEYGQAQLTLSEAKALKARAEAEFPGSVARIEVLRLEAYA